MVVGEGARLYGKLKPCEPLVLATRQLKHGLKLRAALALDVELALRIVEAMTARTHNGVAALRLD